MLITSLAYMEDYIEGDNFRRIMMAKGQERSNKEAKKPKKDKKVVVVSGSIIPTRPSTPAKK